jgi:uncharacterized Zn-binding protein involved in type VI secretion
MAATTRIGDLGIGICFMHQFPIPVSIIHTMGDPIVKSDGIPVTRIGDMCICSCGHPAMNFVGASLTFANGIPMHLVGNSIVWGGIGTSVTGSGLTFSI